MNLSALFADNWETFDEFTEDANTRRLFRTSMGENYFNKWTGF